MSTGILHYGLCTSPSSSKCLRHQTLALNPSQFLPSKSLSILKNPSLLSAIRVKKPKTYKFLILAAQSNFLKVVQTVWKVGKDGIEAGTNLVPDSVPRPIARLSVTVVAVTLALFVLKSVLSTAVFVLAMMGLIYFTFIALNKDEGPKGGGGTASTEDSLEEARRIMEKYK
ncbi:Rho GTPase-activating protein like [Actinidia chinensis var. chinensis]|uniref:Rho GTPase-activating protein like n=1 Tax=Actinidia chinensis var. chinensis TaxID=1590841 RepID=A0A2R6PEI1_ACTCC|nr:Rho GTPase-activating protein like [Actinidia chinensis var. chinensis]